MDNSKKITLPEEGDPLPMPILVEYISNISRFVGDAEKLVAHISDKVSCIHSENPEKHPDIERCDEEISPICFTDSLSTIQRKLNDLCGRLVDIKVRLSKII